jgi:hypothetical protein
MSGGQWVVSLGWVIINLCKTNGMAQMIADEKKQMIADFSCLSVIILHLLICAHL